MITAFIGGSGYAALLWLGALWVARTRTLPLGNWPWATIVLSGCAAASIAALYPSKSACALSATLIGTIVCALVDARTGLIFDVLSASVATVAGTLAFLCGNVVDGAVGAFIVGAFFVALYLITGRRGIGFGDVKLAAALALGYGLQLAVLAVASAFILGAAYASFLIGSHRASRSDALRFGPFIAGGAVVALTANVLGYRW